MSSGRLKNREHRQDVYYKKAKKENYVARAIYKLEEIDRKLHLFQKGDAVLDLGAWPGSWLQYVSSWVGETGTLVAVDRYMGEIKNLKTPLLYFVKDIFEIVPIEILGDKAGFQVVLSDMAPDTSGIRTLDHLRSVALYERALQIAEATLVTGGHFVAKIFQGSEFPDAYRKTRQLFKETKIIKPTSSRKESVEQYIVGRFRK